jgi:hypothetical protein
VNHTASTIIVMLSFSLFLFVHLVNTSTYAQQSAASTITPLSKYQQVPPGKNVVVSGIITADKAAASHCQPSTNESGVKPYQTTTDTGPDRAVEYFNWKFVLASTIKQGSDNKVAAKDTCSSNGVVVRDTPSKQQQQNTVKTNNATTTKKNNAASQPVTSVTNGDNKAIKNNCTGTSASASRILDLIYLDSSKLPGYAGDTKSTARGVPFILPFP